MPDSVKERIEKEIAATLVRELGAAARDVQRWDRRGNEPVPDPDTGALPEAWYLLTFGDEDQQDGASDEAAIGMSELVLPFTIDAHLLKTPAGLSTSAHGNAVIAAIKAAIKSNVTVIEGGPQADPPGERLAWDVKILATYGPASSDEGRDVIVGIEGEVAYRHPEADPYSVG